MLSVWGKMTVLNDRYGDMRCGAQTYLLHLQKNAVPAKRQNPRSAKPRNPTLGAKDLAGPLTDVRYSFCAAAVNNSSLHAACVRVSGGSLLEKDSLPPSEQIGQLVGL